jgi:hypothetical protein
VIDPYAQPDTAAGDRSVVNLVLAVMAALLLLVGVVAVAVGKDDTTDADPVALLGSAPDAVRDAGSARMSMVMDATGAGVSMKMNAEGVVDFVSGAGTFTFSGFGVDFELRTDGTTLWMKLPDMGATDPAKPWVQVPVTSENGLAPNMFMFGPNQATGFLDALRGVGTDVRDLGEEDVNGVHTHHYGVTIDVRRALEQVPEDQRADAEAGLSMIDVNEMPMEVWLSSDGLPVRTTFSFGDTDLFEMAMQMDLTDFGVPVHVEPPPADQVQSFDDLKQLQERFEEQLAGATPQDLSG